jgi:hypothetical protein
VTDPFLVQGPALISFSGGRTSGYMLWRILQAHGGALPDDVVVAFANTGKEREETLRFVHDCETYWDVKVRWVQWLPGRPGFEEVGFNSAARKGEPFDLLIAQKQFLPNVLTRYCTTKLKVETMKKLMVSLGYKHWINQVGLRYDEGARVMRQLRRNEQKKERFTATMPLSDAGIRKADVMAFWADQPFDLQLKPHEGNCDLCMLKGRGKLLEIIRADPSLANWWIAHEERNRAPFRKYGEGLYSELKAQAVNQQDLFMENPEEEHDVECGLSCGGDSPAETAALQAEFERRVHDPR